MSFIIELKKLHISSPTVENDIINQNIVINKLNIKYIIENKTEINSRIYN